MSRRLAARIALAGVLATMSVLGLASSAGASFHLMNIRAVYPGAAPSGAYIELQMKADGQNLVATHFIRICPPAATVCSQFNIPSNVANGLNQRKVLIGDTGAPGPPDFVFAGMGTTLTNFAGGGAACFDTVDCVSWGAFTGEANLPSPAGTPIAGGLSTMLPAVRTIARGCATALDDPDDTNSSAADFAFGAFTPANNAAVPTEKLCTPTPTTAKKKCKKKKKKHSAAAAAKKKKKRCGKKKKKR